MARGMVWDEEYLLDRLASLQEEALDLRVKLEEIEGQIADVEYELDYDPTED